MGILQFNGCSGGGTDNKSGGGEVIIVSPPDAPSNLNAIEAGGGVVDL